MLFVKISNKKHLFSYYAVTIYPFCFYTSDLLERTKRHERIHEKQIFETLYFGFYIWYFVEFVIKLIFVYSGSWNNAYKNVSFEREAYKFAYNEDYLNKRKLFSFLKYLYVKDGNINRENI